MLRIIAWVFCFGIFCATVALSIPNVQPVTLQYYLGSTQLPLAVLLVCSLGMGLILGVAFNLLWVWHLYRKYMRLSKRHQQLQREFDRTLGQSAQDTTTQ
jgi:uncharacterized membrane protein YciS (DUF1049 family)